MKKLFFLLVPVAVIVFGGLYLILTRGPQGIDMPDAVPVAPEAVPTVASGSAMYRLKTPAEVAGAATESGQPSVATPAGSTETRATDAAYLPGVYSDWPQNR